MTRTDRMGYTTTWEYNTSGDLISKTARLDLTDPNKLITMTYEYDDSGRRTAETVDLGGGASTTTTYDYDSVGRVTDVREDVGEGKLNLHTVYTYDGHGLLETVTNPGGTVTKYVYDLRNRLWKVIEDFGTDRANLTTVYGYDENDNRTLVEDAKGNSTTFEYNIRNHLIKSTDAEGYRTYYERDGRGRITCQDRGRSPGEFERSDPETTHDVVVYTYDNLGRVVDKVVGPNSVSLTTHFDYPASTCGCGGVGGGIPEQIIDPAGRTAHRQFDALGRVIKSWRQVNGHEPCPTPESCQDTDDAISWFYYDAEGNLTRTIGPEGEETHYAYDGAGRMLCERKLAGPTLGETSDDDLVTDFVWNAVGSLTQVALPNGHELTSAYDGANRLLHVFDGEGPNKLAEYTYDADGHVLTRKDGVGRTWTYEYDRLGRVTREYDPLAESPTDKYTKHEYDAVGNLLKTRNNAGVWTKRHYDKLNRLRKVIEDDRSTIEEEEEEEPLPAGGRELLDGEAVEGTQGEGVLVGEEGGSGGGQMGPTLELLELSTPTAGTMTRYEYDGAGRLTKLKDHDGNETKYAYDAAGRVTGIVYPPCSATATGDDDDPCKVTFTYSGGGPDFTRTDQRGISTASEFNALGQLHYRSYPERTEEFSFDRSGRLLGAARLWPSSQNKQFAWSRTYDRLGRATQEDEVFHSDVGTETARYTTGFAYAVNTSAHEMSWTATTETPGPSHNRQVVHTMDRLNRLISAAMLDHAGGTEWTHNLAGQRTLAERPNGSNSYTAYLYDDNGRPSRVTHITDTPEADLDIIAGWIYGHDAVGNRTYSRNLAEPGRSERYGYDNLNRLTVMDRGTLNAAGTAVETRLSHAALATMQQWVDLDHRGNWLDYRQAYAEEGVMTSYAQTRTANGVNEYESVDPDGPPGEGQPPNLDPVSPSYDAAGNLTLDPLAANAGGGAATTQPCGTGVPPVVCGQRYVYDEENRVTAVYNANGTASTSDDTLLAQYEYDALGRRVHTIEHVDASGSALVPPRKTRHVYAGLETVEEYDVTGITSGPGTLLREFLWGDPGKFPEPIAMVTHDGELSNTYHYLHDALGSVVGLTDADGQLVERYTYDPYGRTYVERPDGGGWTGGSVSTFGNPWMWTGQRHDAGTGLYAFLYRTYSPSLGRWLQRDPIGYAGGVNLYDYVRGTPLTWLDRYGLDPATSQPGATSCPVPEEKFDWDRCFSACMAKATDQAFEDRLSPELQAETRQANRALCRSSCNMKAADWAREHGLLPPYPPDDPDGCKAKEKCLKDAEKKRDDKLDRLGEDIIKDQIRDSTGTIHKLSADRAFGTGPARARADAHDPRNLVDAVELVLHVATEIIAAKKEYDADVTACEETYHDCLH
jgi:RHS repeat-associated protein